MTKLANWSSEIKRCGWQAALLDRLSFHNGLTIGMVAENAGVCLQTAKKHVARLVANGDARFTHLGDDASTWHFVKKRM